jgi:Restriction endonuclease
MTTQTSRTPKRNSKKLTELTPTEFENLIYDVSILRGMVNVAWRTPGADGGRDIEAMTVEQDFSGVQSVIKWFIECKRYTGSVDWPTIYQKLAYADALGADRLLICTSSKFTPAAITHVDKWNESRRTLLIRLWPMHEIEMQLRGHPDLLMKYGMSTVPDTPGKSIVSLSLALSKTVASSYSEIVFKDLQPSPMMQASQTLADLLLKRMEDMAQGGQIRRVLEERPNNSLDGVEFIGNFSQIDEFGIRAFAAYLHALTRSKIRVLCGGDAQCRIECGRKISDLLIRYREAFDSIAIWSDTEFTFADSNIQVRQRQ